MSGCPGVTFIGPASDFLIDYSSGLRTNASTSVDYNCNGDSTEALTNFDVNNNGVNTEVLRDFDDWSIINLRFAQYIWAF